MPVTGPIDAVPALSAGHNLLVRVISALILAPLVLVVTYIGGTAYVLFWSVAAAAVLWEWIRLVKGPLWVAAGIGYAAIMLMAPVVMRADASFGFEAMLLLFAIVWTTDICGYFAGRAIGGPKLAPTISPKKTWAGAIAGAASAIIVALIVAQWFGRLSLGTVAIIALILSAVSQCGDLLESGIKRHFGAKDASHLIPGHGGVMDRLDGFWAATLVAAVIGIARGGFGGAAPGLLLW